MSKNPKEPQLRKTYPTEEKRAHVIAALASGNVSKYETEHGLGKNIVFSWRRHLPNGVAPAPKLPALKAPAAPKADSRRLDETVMRKHVEAAFADGVNTRSYARAHGLLEQTLYYWHKKIHGVSRADAKRLEKNGHAPKNGHAAPASKQLALVPTPARREAPPADYTPLASEPSNGERRLTATPASLRARVEKLRLENTVLKSVLRLAEMRGFRLWDMTEDHEEERGSEQ